MDVTIMIIKTFILVFLLGLFSLVQSSENSEIKIGEQTKVNSYLCAEEKCIMKCCSEGKFLDTKLIKRPGKKRPRRKRMCEVMSDLKSIENLESENIFFNRPTFSKLNFTVKSGIFESDPSFMKEAVDIANFGSFNIYLTEYPKVFIEHPNAYYRWSEIPNNRFCWEFKASSAGSKELSAGLWAVFEDNAEEPSRTSTDLFTSGMVITCFFLLLVLVVYGMLPELRNLCGLILMAYVTSLLVAFLLLAVLRIKQHNNTACIGLTYSIYFSFLASFCWMNVMSYDIWWTFRGYAKARPIHRRGEKFKFQMYCLYAFGLPLAMTIMLAVLNHTELTHMPWVITPKVPEAGCFLESGQKLLYLYVPMMILILCNWLFFLMTAFNIWRLSRGTAVLDSAAAGTPQAHRTHRHRFMVYLKLSVVMGLNWALEVVSYRFPNQNIWVITDAYNILIGVCIFLIFVCKRKIFRKLKKQIRSYQCCTTSWQPGKVSARHTSSSESSSSNETQTLQVCANPKGPGGEYLVETTYNMKPGY